MVLRCRAPGRGIFFYKEPTDMAHVTALTRITAAGLCLLVEAIFGQSGTELLERQFTISDSAVEALASRPETRMKEIAPAESLFRSSLSRHPEFLGIIRTNSKGLVVNALSREDTTVSRAADVSDEPWYDSPQKSLKPYYGPPRILRGERLALFWSRPIRVKNNTGALRFGGVVSVKINVGEICKQFASAYGGAFQIFLDGKRLYHRGVDSSVMEEKTVHVPGVTGLTCKVAAFARAIAVTVAKDSTDSSSAAASRAAAASSRQAPSVSAPLSGPVTPSARPESAVTAPRMPPQTSESSNQVNNGLLWKMRWLGTIIVCGVFFTVLFMMRRGKKRKAAKPAVAVLSEGGTDTSADNVMDGCIEPQPFLQPGSDQEENCMEQPHRDGQDTDKLEELTVPVESVIVESVAAEAAPCEEIITAATQQCQAPSDTLTQEPTLEPVELQTVAALPPTNVVSQEEESEVLHQAREELFQEIKREITENEMTTIRNTVIAELKTDIRQRLEKNEAEAIHAALEQEITDGWRAEIQTKYYAAFREKELENLVKLIREKLVENEMPTLVERQRSELTKEVREKMAAAFTQQIEEHQRSVLKAEIVKKLQLEEYPALLQHEREKLRSSLALDIAEKETQTLEAHAREELTGKIKTQLLSETEPIQQRLREEFTQTLHKELVAAEQQALSEKIREEITDRIRGELLEKEQQAIHDRLVAEITEEQRRRIETEELQSVIEEQRRRLAQEEAPALREQMRQQVREEELEALHARVKTELYAETVDAVRASLEEKFSGLLETRMAQYREQTYGQAYEDIRRGMEREYKNLIGHMEQLSGAMTKVDALESLSQTIALLTDEKKKYKYFNLNAAQTESLLEYLKRVQSRFNIFLDKVDESVREMELKINSVMNTFTAERK